MQIPRRNDNPSLRIQFIHVVLRRCNVDVLDTIVSREYEGRREDLLCGHVLEVAWELGFENLGEIGTGNEGGGHVVVPARWGEYGIGVDLCMGGVGIGRERTIDSLLGLSRRPR
jgi:hypothetical protein